MHYPHTFELSFTQALMSLLVSVTSISSLFFLFVSFNLPLLDIFKFFTLIFLQWLLRQNHVVTFNVEINRLIGKKMFEKFNELQVVGYTNTHTQSESGRERKLNFDNSNVILHQCKAKQSHWIMNVWECVRSYWCMHFDKWHDICSDNKRLWRNL